MERSPIPNYYVSVVNLLALPVLISQHAVPVEQDGILFQHLELLFVNVFKTHIALVLIVWYVTIHVIIVQVELLQTAKIVLLLSKEHLIALIRHVSVLLDMLIRE